MAALGAGAVVGAGADAPQRRGTADARTLGGPGGPQTPRARLDRAIGQRIVTSFAGRMPGPLVLRLAREGRIGGVILFAPNIATVAQVRRAVARLQAAARAGANPPLLVTVDQEGGPVKRFARLPPAVAPRAMTATRAAREGRATGLALRRAGVNIDLAPVADVTTDRGSFLYARSFASPAAVCAFAQGLRDAGILPALKHFPGLGGATVNTDDGSVTLHADAATLRARAVAYRRCATPGLVMVASASYPDALGAGPALLRPATYALLRSLGVDAPTITDSLQAQALAPYAHAPLRAALAGADLLLLTGSEQAAADVYLGLAGASRRGDLPDANVTAAAARIAALKARLPSP